MEPMRINRLSKEEVNNFDKEVAKGRYHVVVTDTTTGENVLDRRVKAFIGASNDGNITSSHAIIAASRQDIVTTIIGCKKAIQSLCNTDKTLSLLEEHNLLRPEFMSPADEDDAINNVLKGIMANKDEDGIRELFKDIIDDILRDHGV